MALVTTEKMLKDAQAGHYAVGAFNVENLEFVMAVLAAAEETKSPVIMQTTPGTIKTAGLDYFYGMVKAAAERASVPVALHLDHGDGYDRCMQAFRTGYTSVMIDRFARVLRGQHRPDQVRRRRWPRHGCARRGRARQGWRQGGRRSRG